MSDSIKIFDCSNSDRRPNNRGFGGPVENTIVRDLKKYAHDYDFEFVTDIQLANVAFTNDVFTDEVLSTNIPRVKRMDGVFFQDGLRARNESLNLAAQQADSVIFISEFSRDAYHHLYGERHALKKKSTVILNWVDDTVFEFQDHSFCDKPERFVSISTSWERPEKRLNAIIALATCNPSLEFHLIGNMEKLNVATPTNVFNFGYIEDELILCDILSDMDAMVCTAFRDAAPKTVAQGLAVGLPLFYANSGGVPELVRGNGFGFDARDEHKFYANIPQACGHIAAFEQFCSDYHKYVKNATIEPDRYQNVMKSYFDEFSSVL